MTLMCDSLGTKAKEVRWVSLFTQLFLCIQSREVDMGFVWWWWCWCWLVFIFSFLCQYKQYCYIILLKCVFGVVILMGIPMRNAPLNQNTHPPTPMICVIFTIFLTTT